MAKYEADWKLLNKFKKSIIAAKCDTKRISGIDAIQKVTLAEGEHYYTMDIIYASLLAEHIEEQLKAGNIVDVQLFSGVEWLKMEEQLQEELEENN